MKNHRIALIAGIVGAVVLVAVGDLISSQFAELSIALRAAIGFVISFALAKLLTKQTSSRGA